MIEVPNRRGYEKMKTKEKLTIGAMLIAVLLASTALLFAANTSGDASEEVSINKESYVTHRSISQQPTSNALTEKIVNKTYTPINEIFLIRNFTEPISIEEIKEKREKTINNFVNAMGKPKHAIAIATPEVPEGVRIVAYGFRIYPNGVTAQYVGMADDDEESVQIIHEHAQEWYDKYEVLTSTGVLGEPHWVEIGRNEGEIYHNPHGGVDNNYVLFQLADDTSSTRDWFAIHHIFCMYPGCHVYGSNWRNDYGMLKHDWSASDFGNPQLHDHDPMGTHTGTQTISVSLGPSPALQWSYTQPGVTTLDESDSSIELARWKETFNSEAAQTHPGGMEPGSSCGVNQPSGGTYKLLDLVAEGHFKLYPIPAPATLTHTWHISVMY